MKTSHGLGVLRGLLLFALVGLVIAALVFGYFYYKYQRVVDDSTLR